MLKFEKFFNSDNIFAIIGIFLSIFFFSFSLLLNKGLQYIFFKILLSCIYWPLIGINKSKTLYENINCKNNKNFDIFNKFFDIHSNKIF